MKRLLVSCMWLVLAIGIGCWSLFFLLLSPALPSPLRVPAATFMALLLILSIPRWRARRSLRIAVLLAYMAVGALWSSVRPSNDRNWIPEVSRTPYATVNGDLVTIENVRNFHYRSESDFDVVYETKTVDLAKLDSADMIVSYWAGDEIAHIMVSFGFGDSDYLAISIETRPQVGQAYSPLKGFFRNYELVYVVADERDVLGVRALYRDPIERVHILRSNMPAANARKLFLEYIRSINQLHDHPAFYNTLTTNCTTQVLRHAQAFGSSARYSWKILLSGYVPEYLYENGSLGHDLSYDEIFKRSLVTDVIRATPLDGEFSKRIREEVPKPQQKPIDPDPTVIN